MEHRSKRSRNQLEEPAKNWFAFTWATSSRQENSPPDDRFQSIPIPTLTKAGKPFFTELVNYTDAALGTHVVFATDEFKSNAANILVDNPDLHWTTRRRRTAGYDWCILKLPVPIVIRGVEIVTTDDAPPHISMEAALDVKNVSNFMYKKLQEEFPGYIPRAEAGGSQEHSSNVQKVANRLCEFAASWNNVIDVSPIKRGATNYFEVTTDDRLSSELKVDLIRLNLLPDGGITRLKVYGEIALDIGPMHKLKEREHAERTMDYAAASNGGQVCFATAGRDTVNNLILPYCGGKCDNFWITPRQPLRPMFIQPSPDGDIKLLGSESAIIALAARCYVTTVDVSTAGIQGDLPLKIILSMLDASDIRQLTLLRQRMLFSEFSTESQWFEFGTLDDLSGEEEYTVTLNTPMTATHLKVEIVPDGAVTRIRVNGHFCDLDSPNRID